MRSFHVFALALSMGVLGGVACTTESAQVEGSRANLGEAKLVDDVSLDPIEDSKADPLLADLEPITAKPDGDLTEDTEDTVSVEMAKKAIRPQEYIAARAKKPRKFAAATVLAAMRRLRRFYHTQPYEVFRGRGTWVTAAHARGISLADQGKFPVASDEADFTTPFDDFRLTWNTAADGTDGSNMSVMPIFWSEIQAHFFLLPPHRRHGCWTMATYGLKGCTDPFVKGTDETSFREAVNALCSGQKPLRADATDGDCAYFQQAVAAIPVQMSAFNLLWVDPAKRAFVALPEDVRTALDLTDLDPSKIEGLTAVKWSEKQRSKGYVNVWEYLMTSQLYAFDWEQQQAVLNAFYGDNKAFSGDRKPFDPNDTRECLTWRPQRPHDPMDGTHCRADKNMKFPVLSAGR